MTDWAHGIRPDGTRVRAVRVPGARALGLSVVFAGGFAAERDGEAGTAHLVEHLVHHHGGRDHGVPVNERVLAAGGVSNAQTYPFHTEYSFLVADGEDTARKDWVAAALRRADPLEITDADVARECALIRREVAERTAASPLAGFPWAGALNAIAASPSTNLLTDLRALDHASVASVSRFHDERRAAPLVALGVAADADPRGMLQLAGATESEPVASPPVVVPGRCEPREVREVRGGLTAPVHAEVRVVHPPLPRSTARAALMLATRVASATTAGSWRAGLFGDLLGPDAEIVVSTLAGAPAGLALSAPSSVPRARALRQALPEARRQAARAVSEFLSGTGTASALAARDALAGLDLDETSAAIHSLGDDVVLSLVEAIQNAPAGRITWDGGGFAAPGEVAA